MAVTLIVNNTPFDYPEQGESQPWGEPATNWAIEVTDVLSSLRGSSDILETASSVLNGQLTPVSITGLFFDITTVRSFVVQGNISRQYGSGSQKNEQFTIVGINNGSDFDIQQDGIGDAEVDLSILPTGQLQYTSSILSSGLTGVLKFRGIGILKS
jgi:hypothetical protein